MSGVMNVLQLVGCLPATLALDKLGRRTMLLRGAAICLIAHVIIASIVGAFYTNWPAHAGGGWAGVAFIFVYMLAFGGTWGPIAWAVPSEIYPTSIRAKGVAISVATLWFCNFIVSGSHSVRMQGRRSSDHSPGRAHHASAQLCEAVRGVRVLRVLRADQSCVDLL